MRSWPENVPLLFRDPLSPGSLGLIFLSFSPMSPHSVPTNCLYFQSSCSGLGIFPGFCWQHPVYLIPRWPHWKPRWPMISFVTSPPASKVPKVPQYLCSAGREFICLLHSMFYFVFNISLNSRFLSVPSPWTTLTDLHMAGFPFRSSLTQHWCLFLRKVFGDPSLCSGHPTSIQSF